MAENAKDRPQLTRKEKELLDLLEQNPGRCFSRAYLLSRIWGYSDHARTRTVDVHVSRLRKKLEGRRDIAIHTVVRHGYVLEQRSPSQAEDSAHLTGPLDGGERTDRPAQRAHAAPIRLGRPRRHEAAAGAAT